MRLVIQFLALSALLHSGEKCWCQEKSITYQSIEIIDRNGDKFNIKPSEDLRKNFNLKSKKIDFSLHRRCGSKEENSAYISDDDFVKTDGLDNQEYVFVVTHILGNENPIILLSWRGYAASTTRNTTEVYVSKGGKYVYACGIDYTAHEGCFGNLPIEHYYTVWNDDGEKQSKKRTFTIRDKTSGMYEYEFVELDSTE